MVAFIDDIMKVICLMPFSGNLMGLYFQFAINLLSNIPLEVLFLDIRFANLCPCDDSNKNFQ